MPTAEALVAGRHIQQDDKRRHVVGLNVAVDQKPLAVFGNVVGEDVGGGNGGAAVDLEEGSRGSGHEGAFGWVPQVRARSLGANLGERCCLLSP